MLRLSVCLLTALAVSGQSQRADTARAVVSRAIDAMGGQAALKSISALQIDAIGHEYFIDQSERPEGPFIVVYFQTTEQRDVAGGRSRIETQRRFTQVPDWAGAGTATVVDSESAAMQRGDRFAPAGREAFEDGRERIELAPERLLLTALAAPDLTSAPDAKIHGIAQKVVTFGWRGRAITLFIDSGDFVPTASEVSAQDTFGIWGKVRNTTYYSLWTLINGGVRYPLQMDRQWNGVTNRTVTIMKMAVNPTVDPAQFSIPSAIKEAFSKLPTAARLPSLQLDTDKGRVEIVPGKIVQYGGSWNVGVVQQPDGLVIIEAPIGSHYSAQVLEDVAQRYPGVKVKAVLTTSDAWPHLGGAREYAARGIPVYGLDLNKPILDRLMAADYGLAPDLMHKSPRRAQFTWVSGKTVIGTGDTRMELYPIRGENGERMMMVYFPAFKLLYTSDEVQRQRGGGFFMPELLLEVKDAIAREKLDVERIFGFHVGATPWTEVEDAIRAASAR